MDNQESARKIIRETLEKMRTDAADCRKAGAIDRLLADLDKMITKALKPPPTR